MVVVKLTMGHLLEFKYSHSRWALGTREELQSRDGLDFVDEATAISFPDPYHLVEGCCKSAMS